MAPVYVALIHGPVLNRKGDLITTAITGLNVHDIARASTTYGISGYFIVTPLATQQGLVRRMTDHWEGGFGAAYNPNRKVALAAVNVVDTLELAMDEVATREGSRPWLVATSARTPENAHPVSFSGLKGTIATGDAPIMLAFGTAWGLPDEALVAADMLLPPIHGPGAYNHLSVRSAVAIILDRLLGRDGEAMAKGS